MVYARDVHRKFHVELNPVQYPEAYVVPFYWGRCYCPFPKSYQGFVLKSSKKPLQSTAITISLKEAIMAPMAVWWICLSTKQLCPANGAFFPAPLEGQDPTKAESISISSLLHCSCSRVKCLYLLYRVLLSRMAEAVGKYLKPPVILMCSASSPINKHIALPGNPMY